MRKSIKCNGNVKDTWKFINEILNNSENKPIISITDDNDNKITGSDMVNHFNQHFINLIFNFTANDIIIKQDMSCLKYISLNLN